MRSTISTSWPTRHRSRSKSRCRGTPRTPNTMFAGRSKLQTAVGRLSLVWRPLRPRDSAAEEGMWLEQTRNWRGLQTQASSSEATPQNGGSCSSSSSSSSISTPRHSGGSSPSTSSTDSNRRGSPYTTGAGAKKQVCPLCTMYRVSRYLVPPLHSITGKCQTPNLYCANFVPCTP